MLLQAKDNNIIRKIINNKIKNPYKETKYI